MWIDVPDICFCVISGLCRQCLAHLLQVKPVMLMSLGSDFLVLNSVNAEILLTL